MKTRTQNVFIRQIQTGFGILIAIFIIDRLLKYWTVTELTSKSIIIIPDILHFSYVPNPNLLYILNLPVWLISILIIVTMIGLSTVLYSSWHRGRQFDVLGISSMLLGATSNIFDRWVYGSVIDMISIPFWSTFNIADLMIVVGAAIVFWSALHNAPPAVAEK